MRNGFRLLAAICFALTAGFADPALAEKRVALVIGNGNYNHVAGLPNVANDAAAMAALFKSAKFDSVWAKNDLPVSEMRRVLTEFAARAANADVAVLFFAGHGVEVDGVNYLIPVDARFVIGASLDAEIVSLDHVLQALQPARRLRLVVLDACRENPFTGRMRRSLGDRSVGRGLGRIEPATANTFVAYAAKAGAVAADGKGPNSPFTAALIKHLLTPWLDLRIAFGHVRDEVLANTGNKQEPWLYFTAGGGVVSLVSGSHTLTSPAILEGPRPTPDAKPIGASETNAKPAAGAEYPVAFKDCDACPEMVAVPAGAYWMGAPDGEPGRRKIEQPMRQVVFAKPFAAGRHAVTREQFKAFVAATRYKYGESCHVAVGDQWVLKGKHSFLSPGFTQGNRHPAVCLSWSDATAYATWLSARTGKRYRLLSEAEREYVARAGTTTPYWWGATVDYKQANYDTRRDAVPASPQRSVDCPRREGTLPVQCFEPNPWGFFQVHGNVAEWTLDCWNRSYDVLPTDGSPALVGDCSRRVLRGGAWSYWPEDIRAAYRESAPADNRYFHVGFRVARDLGE